MRLYNACCRTSCSIEAKLTESKPPQNVIIDGRCFLVGCGRSGTTLLQSLLASHSNIASFPETWLFAMIAGRHPSRLYGWPPATLKERLLRIRDTLRFKAGLASIDARPHLIAFLKSIDRDDLLAEFPPEEAKLNVQLHGCIKLLDQLCWEQKKTNWLEKTPLHLGYVDLIESTAPDALFIHLLRDGPEVVASLYDATVKYPSEWKWVYPTLDHCITQWNHCISLMRKHLGKPNHILVRYECLTEDPEGVLKTLCGFLGVEYECDMLKAYSETAKHLRFDKEQWKEKSSAPIARSEKFQSVFNESQRAYILHRLTPLNRCEMVDPASSV